jgi:septal ring-binding cell division protein DamX
MAEAFPISGNIDPTTFPFLLMDLHRRGATGSLKVEGPSHPKALYFRGGRILFGSSNDMRDQLGSILIEQGKITLEQLEDVNAKVGPGNPLATVLAGSGFVNQRELGDAARIKVERILSDVIAYTSGSFEIEEGVLPKGAVDLKLSTEKLLLAAVGRMGDRTFVLRHLESLGVVLAPASDADARLGEIRAEAQPLLERLDGRRSLKEAVALTRLDEFEGAKLACSLLFLGLVTRVAAGEGAAAKAGEGDLDLAATARSAFGEEPDAFVFAAPAPGADPPFFVPESPAEPPPPTADGVFPMPDPTAVGAHGPAFAEPELDGARGAGAFGANAVPAFVVPEEPVLDLAQFASPPEPEPMASVPTAFQHRSPFAQAAAPPATPDFVASEPAGDPTLVSFDPSTLISPESPRTGAPAAAPSNVFEVDTLPGFSPSASASAPQPSFDEDLPGRPSYTEPEDNPVTLPPTRPSKEDLAALDALLNPSAASLGSARPMERPKPEPRWEPQFRPVAGPRNPVRRGRVPVVPIALGALGLAAAAGAGYYFLVLKPQAALVALSQPTSTLPATSVSTTAPGPTDVASPGSAAPNTGPTTAPTSATTAPVTVAPVPPKTVPTTTLRPQPSPPAPSPRTSGAPKGDARGLLRSGAYAEAARGFAADLRGTAPGQYSVQLLVACSEDTVQKAVASVPAEELFILPTSYQGRSCYRLCWGIYASEAQAAAAERSLPDYFRRGGARPKVSPLAGLLP